MLQIQENRVVSEVFLQQATLTRIHHTSWLMHHIEFLNSRQFLITDPIFGYCAAVLATIELHLHRGKESSCRKKKKEQLRELPWFYSEAERHMGFYGASCKASSIITNQHLEPRTADSILIGS
jgi:hypothetical protein